MIKTKKEILNKNGWESMFGYCFDTPCADNEMLTFVDKEEVEKVLQKGVQEYFWNESHEQLYELDEAWEYFCDDVYIDGDTDESIIMRFSKEDD